MGKSQPPPPSVSALEDLRPRDCLQQPAAPTEALSLWTVGCQLNSYLGGLTSSTHLLSTPVVPRPGTVDHGLGHHRLSVGEGEAHTGAEEVKE